MIVNKIQGRPQLIYAGDRVRVAQVDNGKSFACYVLNSKTTHLFENADSMLEFVEKMALVPAEKPVSLEEFQVRMRPLLNLTYIAWTKNNSFTYTLIQKIIELEKIKYEIEFLFPFGIEGIKISQYREILEDILLKIHRDYQ